MSELNGHRPGTPVEGEPEQTRPVTFTWQRQPAPAAEESAVEAGEPSSAQPADTADQPRQTGSHPAVSGGPPSGTQPIAHARGPITQPPGPSTGAQRAMPGPPTSPPAGWSSAAQRVPAQYAPVQPQVPQQQAPLQQAATLDEPRSDVRSARSGRRRGGDLESPISTGPETPFPVPAPGGRLSHGRGAHLAVRVGIAFTCCLLLLGFTFIIGLFAGRVGSDRSSGISTNQLGNYHVDTFPLQAAAAVAERYTRLCLNAQPATAGQRSAELQSIVSSSVPSDCGWDGRGTLSATDIAWNGQVDPMTQYGAHGRYLHIQAALGAKATPIQLIVPVYVANLSAATGVRIAGEPGILPNNAAPSRGDAVTEKDGSSDTGLAQMLTADVLPGFFEAWATSSSADIDRYRTTDATDNVRHGLSDALSNPQVEAVNVPLPGSGIGSAHTWQPGDAATVETTVTWQVPCVSHLTLGYRLTMIRTSSTAIGWSVKDIAGGLPDSDLDNTTSDNIPTELPTSAVPTEAPTPTPTPPSPPAKTSKQAGAPKRSTRHSTTTHSPHHRS